MAFSFVSIPGYVGCAVLALRGELDFTDAPGLSLWIADAVPREPWVIIDLADLAFIDCSSFRALAGARELARASGGDVLLAGPRGAVARVLVLMGWDEVFPVFPGVAPAAFSVGLAALGGRPVSGEDRRATGQQGYRGAA